VMSCVDVVVEDELVLVFVLVFVVDVALVMVVVVVFVSTAVEVVAVVFIMTVASLVLVVPTVDCVVDDASSVVFSADVVLRSKVLRPAVKVVTSSVGPEAVGNSGAIVSC